MREAPLAEFAHQRAAVIALVGDHFAWPSGADLLDSCIAVVASATTLVIRSPASATVSGNRCSVSNICPVQRDGNPIAPVSISTACSGLVSQMGRAHPSSW